MPDSRLRRFAPFLIVAAAAIAAHARSLGADLVYDDRVVLLEDERLGTLAGALDLLLTPYWGDFARDPLYRPATSLTFALVHALFGPSPLAHHALNLLLHALAAALVLRVARTLVPDRPRAALAAALLFACHPALSEAVTGAVGRADLLAAVFTLLAALAALGGGASGRPFSATVFAGLAFLSKESAAGLAIAIPLAASLRPDARPRAARAIRAAIPLSAILLAAVLLRENALSSADGAEVLAGIENPLREATAPVRVVTALHVLGRYAAILLFPIRLRADASFAEIRLIETPLDPLALLGGASLAALAAAALVSARRGRPAALPALLALLPILVVANIFFAIGTVYGERLLYVPAVGLAGLFACAPLPRIGRRAAIPLAIVLALFAARTLSREGIYATEERYFRAMAADSPQSAKAWTNLAFATRRSDPAGADRALDRALEILPTLPLALAEKGSLAAARGDSISAEAFFRRAVAAAPGYATAHLQLAQTLSGRENGNLEEAARHFEDAMRLAPKLPEAPYGLGALRFRQGLKDDALRLFEEAIRRDPAFAYGYYGRATVLVDRRDLEGAERDFGRAREIWGEFPRDVTTWLKRLAKSDPEIADLLRRLGLEPE